MRTTRNDVIVIEEDVVSRDFFDTLPETVANNTNADNKLKPEVLEALQENINLDNSLNDLRKEEESEKTIEENKKKIAREFKEQAKKNEIELKRLQEENKKLNDLLASQRETLDTKNAELDALVKEKIELTNQVNINKDKDAEIQQLKEDLRIKSQEYDALFILKSTLSIDTTNEIDYRNEEIQRLKAELNDAKLKVDLTGNGKKHKNHSNESSSPNKNMLKPTNNIYQNLNDLFVNGFIATYGSKVDSNKKCISLFSKHGATGQKEAVEFMRSFSTKMLLQEFTSINDYEDHFINIVNEAHADKKLTGNYNPDSFKTYLLGFSDHIRELRFRESQHEAVVLMKKHEIENHMTAYSDADKIKESYEGIFTTTKQENVVTGRPTLNNTHEFI